MSTLSSWIKTQEQSFAKANLANPAKNTAPSRRELAILAELALANTENTKNEQGQELAKLAELALANTRNPKNESQDLWQPVGGQDKQKSASGAVAKAKMANSAKNEIPGHVAGALEAAGVILPDELPAWTPGHCQGFLLMVKGVSRDFRLRGPRGWHGLDCPDRWPADFNAALQSIYVTAMRVDEKAWREFLDRFDVT